MSKNKLMIIIAGFVLILLIIAIIAVLFYPAVKSAQVDARENGILYSDSFTGNTARQEWQFGLNNNTAAPTMEDNRLKLSGNGSVIGFAMLKYPIPDKAAISFTVEIAKRGAVGRDPTIFFNVGESYNNRYQLWLSEKSIRITYNYNTNLVVKRVEELVEGGTYGFTVVLDGARLAVYFNGSTEPIIDYTADLDHENLKDARTFGIVTYANLAWFDNLLITDPTKKVVTSQIGIYGRNNKNVVEGIGSRLQMMSFISPINVSDSFLVWKIDNPDIASITQDGMLTALSQGEVKVSAYTRDGSNLITNKTIKIRGTATQIANKTSGNTSDLAIKTLASDYVEVFRSPDPKNIYAFSPGICVLPSGRLVATCDLYGTGVETLVPLGQDKAAGWKTLGKIYTSDDGGKTWAHRMDGEFMHARPFVADGKVYVLGHNGDLIIYSSSDNGDTWSKPVKLTEGQHWHAAPTNVWYKDNYIYLAMEKNQSTPINKALSGIAPILMRAKVTDDLTKVENWTFSKSLIFGDLITDAYNDKTLDWMGVPFMKKTLADVGWLETNVVQIQDEKHIWYDPTGKSFYLFMRGSTLGSGYAAMLKVVENSDGSMSTSVVKAPSEKNWLFLPMPGGQNKFHVVYDEKSKLYWLLSSQSTNSMTAPKYLEAYQMGMPDNERDRLALYFSKNMVDWCFAGLVDKSADPSQSRSYASMCIDGNDMLVLSRTGDKDSVDLHNNNLITFHRVKNFRDLIY